MRDKEVLQDYRFMAEPNLPPIIISNQSSNQHTISLEEQRGLMPELRSHQRDKLLNCGLKLEHVTTIMVSMVWSSYTQPLLV